MSGIDITDQEFGQFQRFIFAAAGISMSDGKKALVSGRLAKRLQQHGLGSYGAYFRLLTSGTAPQEVQTAVDLLTTNETYFFRETVHFDALRAHARATGEPGRPYRVWSAACSSGEEAYSMAMVLDDSLGQRPWEIVATDISTQVLRRAQAGHYPDERARHTPPEYLRRYCLKGHGEQQGTLLVAAALRERVRFAQVNLNQALPSLGTFDAIFLRNVMIYFSPDTKRQVVARVLSLLRPGGLFCIGRSESLNDISDAVQAVAPSVFRKP
ncbi:protein-glutamate O-methyltransferase CheR [Rugamonas sp. A1-17]|nr:protein-glutamate O-methyltransferase CheR [Rugamonas sp. A1-17]